MASLREVRNRIQSIKSTRQITGAMKMVAASKLHRAQQTIVHVRRYAEKLGMILSEVNKQIPFDLKNKLTIDRGERTALLISIASNKGLCGSYNAQVLKRTITRIRFLEKQKIECKLFLFGRKNENYFRKNNIEVQDIDHDLLDKLTFDKTKNLAGKIAEQFLNGEYDRVDVIYNRFHNAVAQELVIEQLLPVSFEDMNASQVDDIPYHDHGHHDDFKEPTVHESMGYILEPEKKAVLDSLVTQYIDYNLYRIFADASASEHGARMTSMHKATDNADQLLHELTLTYNKVRQALITREIMEIIGGAEK